MDRPKATSLGAENALHCTARLWARIWAIAAGLNPKTALITNTKDLFFGAGCAEHLGGSQEASGMHKKAIISLSIKDIPYV